MHVFVSSDQGPKTPTRCSEVLRGHEEPNVLKNKSPSTLYAFKGRHRELYQCAAAIEVTEHELREWILGVAQTPIMIKRNTWPGSAHWNNLVGGFPMMANGTAEQGATRLLLLLFAKTEIIVYSPDV